MELDPQKSIIEQYPAVTEFTAKYPTQVAFSYLALGLFDELVELEEKHVNAHFSGTEAADVRNDLKHELGDGYWYACELYRGPLSIVRPNGFVSLVSSLVGDQPDRSLERDKTSWSYIYHTPTYYNLRLAAGTVAGRSKKFLRDFNGLEAVIDGSKIFHVAAEWLDSYMEHYVYLTHRLGFTVPEVLLANCEKLLDRKERNVLSGDGDHR